MLKRSFMFNCSTSKNFACSNKMHLCLGESFREDEEGCPDSLPAVAAGRPQSASMWFILLDLLWISSRKVSSCSMRTRFLNLCCKETVKASVRACIQLISNRHHHRSARHQIVAGHWT